MSEVSTELVHPQDEVTGRRMSWRRRVNRSTAPIAAIAGIILVFAGAIFVEEDIAKVAMIAAGILVVEAGVWYMANPIFTSERRYAGLRDELDNLIGLVRELNRAAVHGGGSDEVERLKAALHHSVDVMGKLAGKRGEEN